MRKSDELLLLQRLHPVHRVFELPAQRPYDVIEFADVEVGLVNLSRVDGINDAVPKITLNALRLHRHLQCIFRICPNLFLDPCAQPVNFHLLLELFAHFLVFMLLFVEDRVHNFFHLFEIGVIYGEDLEVVPSTLKEININILLFH